MRFEGIIDWVLRRIEVVDVDEVDEHAREKVTSVREHNFTTLLDWQVLVLLDCVRENVHHSNPIEESNDNLETCRVEGHALSLILELLIDLELEAKRRAVAPNLDSLV